VIEPPRRKLDRELDEQRHTGANWEAKIKAEQRQERKFRQPILNAGNSRIYDERNPPPDDTIPDGPGGQAKPATPSGDDGIPGFLDRRRPNAAEPMFVDLVGGDR
jgi:hypothetical protein